MTSAEPYDREKLVVTGGRGAIAGAIAAHFREGRWDVFAPGRDDLDVADPTSICRFFHNQPPPDLLVCAAGITRDAPLLHSSLRDWQHVIDVNFHGARACALACLPAMRSAGAGHIVFISSHSALHPPAGQAAYATAKAALHGLCRDLATSAGQHGIRVNVILPGLINTPITRHLLPKRRDEILREHALGRFNTLDVVANFIWHLHHELPHTSGQCFQLDSRPA